MKGKVNRKTFIQHAREDFSRLYNFSLFKIIKIGPEDDPYNISYVSADNPVQPTFWFIYLMSRTSLPRSCVPYSKTALLAYRMVTFLIKLGFLVGKCGQHLPRDK